MQTRNVIKPLHGATFLTVFAVVVALIQGHEGDDKND